MARESGSCFSGEGLCVCGGPRLAVLRPPKGCLMPFTSFQQCHTEKAACSGQLLCNDAA